MRTVEDLRELIQDAPHLKNIEGHAQLVGGDKAFFEILSLIHHATDATPNHAQSSSPPGSPESVSKCPMFQSKPNPLGLSTSIHAQLDQRQWTQHFLENGGEIGQIAASVLTSYRSSNETEISKAKAKEIQGDKSGSEKTVDAKENDGGVVNLSPDHAKKPADRPGFSKRIKEGTSESHKAAESVLFVKKFVRGEINPQLYQQLVVDLYHVYRVMEKLLEEHASHALIRPIYFPKELNRTAALEADLEYWFGEGWRSSTRIEPTPCTREYMDRLQSCTAAGLVAHAYTRYMGDLSGGRVLMSKAKKAFGLTSNEGLAFYVFDEIASPVKFKNGFRDALDGLEIPSEAVADEIITEANIAFLLNMRLFSELDLMAGEIDGMQSLEATVKAMKAMSVEPKIAKCPFAKMGSLLVKSEKHEAKEAGANEDVKKGVLGIDPAILLAIAALVLSLVAVYLNQ